MASWSGAGSRSLVNSTGAPSLVARLLNPLALSWRQRELLEQVLDGIYIYADGDIVVQFREAGLFEPVSSYTLRNLEAEAPALPEARARQEQGVAMVTEAVRCIRPDEDLKDVDFMVSEDANGSPWVMAMKNARVVRRGGAVPGTGPGSSSAKHTEVGGKANDQGTLASPRRVSGRLDGEPPAEKTVGVPNGTPPILSWLEMRLVG